MLNKLKINNNLFLIAIILIAIFFRFYRLPEFQYWSVDEGGVYFSARRIFVLAKPVLLAPSATTVVSMGPLFTYLSALLFYLTSSNPVLVLAFGSSVGVIVTLLIFITAKTLFNVRVGLIAAFLYSSSFLISFFDRRWWQLSLDPLLVLLAAISIYKISEKKYYYSLPLAIATSFAWNADPSLLVILLATFLSFIFLKIPLFKRQYLPAVVWLILSLSPFFISELRHSGSITRPLNEYTSKIFQASGKKVESFSLVKISQIIENLNRALFTQPSLHIDDSFFCLSDYPSSWFSPYSILIILALLVLSSFLFLSKNKKKYKKSIFILYLFIISFISGILAFSLLTNVEIIQSYFLVIWPVFLILLAVGLDWAIRKKATFFACSFLIVVFFLNLYTLIKSDINYSLKTKFKVVDSVIDNLKPGDYALYPKGLNYGFEGGGWDSLFAMRQRPAAWSSFTFMTKWIFQAYSMYPTTPKKEGSLKQRVILLAPDIKDSFESFGYDKDLKIEEIRVLIKN